MISDQEILELVLKYHKSGELEKAECLYREILEAQPSNAVVFNNLANILQDKGQLDEAIICYQKALDLKPDYVEAYYNVADALRSKGKLDEAISCYQQAIKYNPDFSYAYNNLAIVLKDKGRIDEAIICCRKAVELEPGFVEAIYNLGNALQDKGQFEEALACYERTLKLNPNHVGAYSNIGNIFHNIGQVEKAEKFYRYAMQAGPDDPTPYKILLMAMNYNPEHDPQTIFSEHLRFARQYAEPLYPSAVNTTDYRLLNRRLKVGYVSPDFRRHSIAYFIEPVLTLHRRKYFEIFCYSDVLVPDDVTERIQKCSEHWRNIALISDENVADLIRKDKIDILIDLAGYTDNNRILLFARKPAPVQVSWLGYPATTGLSTMDYKIVDNYTDPPGMTEKFYTEKLIRMRDSFLCYSPDRESPHVGILSALTSGHITFCSFNNLAKITPEVITLWARILKEVSGARLILKARSFSDKSTCKYVTDSFNSRGIVADRLELLSWEPSTKEHLSTYNRIDIALDTYPYNGTTTTCEALWMGVPVVTLAGDTHVSRVGASILSNVRLNDLIADTNDEYVRIAVELATDIKKLRELHENLREKMRYSLLTNAEKFIFNLEECYQMVWEKW